MTLEELIHFLESGDDVDAQLKAFDELNSRASAADLPVLLATLRSPTSNFWVRELLSEPIVRLAGAQALPQLFDALETNEAEGHDNDGFTTVLVVLVATDPTGVKAELAALEPNATATRRKTIEWLREYCG